MIQREIENYIDRVISGKEVCGELVQLAVQRHLDDLVNLTDHYFDWQSAERFIGFTEDLLVHFKGAVSGKPFILSDYQKFKFACLFGWKRVDGLRRFRTAYNEIARKNGKSTEACAVGLYMMIADREGAPEVYSAATKKDQAKIVFDTAKGFIRNSPDLKSILGIHRDNIHLLETSAKFEPLASDSKTLDGLNTHCGIIDELHAHRTSEVVDLISTSTGARSQPLIYEITTAGSNRESVCFKHREYSEKILRGIVKDDSWFSMIFTIDQEDDWQDEQVWLKANPNLGKAIALDYFKTEAAKAANMPSYLNSFLRLHLNIWTESFTRFISDESWKKCEKEIDLHDLVGKECYAGLDLASTTDISAFVLLFPNAIDDRHVVIPYFWIPGDTAYEKSRSDQVDYLTWSRQGHIHTTPGNVTDYRYIHETIVAVCDKFSIKSIAYDDWNSSQLVNELMGEGLPMHPCRQGYKSLSPPSKEFERNVLSELIYQNGNPVMRWMLSNVFMETDPAGNIKPSKKKSTEKIDGIVALVMAYNHYMSKNENQPILTSWRI